MWLGPFHGCATLKTGGLECWGANDVGQLGDGTTTQRLFPVAATVAMGAPEELAIGNRHTCGLFAGQPRCWGDGARGQLAAPAGIVAMVISSAGDRTCVLTKEGAVRCWGAKDPRGPGAPESGPPEGISGVASLLAMGPGWVCAAITEPSRMVRCSGADDSGQSAGSKPVLAGAAIKGLTAGGGHTCALLEDGAVQCWGKNDKGQLGDGTTTNASAPALVHGLPAAIEIRAGASHTCARLRNNTVACWGDNHAHQLANGTAEPSARPLPLQGLVGVFELALGGDSACARLAEGGARCWGANAAGQLGDGTTTNASVPALVHGLPAAIEIRAGASHTCARLRNNTVACWGDNHAHQLANGTAEPSARPLPLQGLVGVFELALGGDSACARLAEGGARCWGANAAGQLGDGTTADHDVPMPIRSPVAKR